MKEIGGYLGFEQLINYEYYTDLVALNSGRNCLAYLIKAKNIKKLYIPYFLCESVKNVCKISGCEVEEYHIDYNFRSIFDKELSDSEYLYIVNYYGQIDNNEIIALKDQYKNIIFDNAQAFFQKPVKGIDTLYTCRKFFGVPDGAYLSTDKELYVKLETDISLTRMGHILGRYEGTASDYYVKYMESEKSFNNVPIKYMSKLTHNILGAIDYEKVRKIRSQNYAYLENELGELNLLDFKTPDGPFAYPFFVEKAIEIRAVMVQKNIYIPALWPNVLTDMSAESLEFKFAKSILPLPCDQRYGIEDMKYIIKTYKEYKYDQ